MKKNLSIFMTAGSWLQRALALFLCVAALEAVQAAPQDTKRTITGTVVDQNNLPVVGATVMISNSANGTATDSNGQFTLSGVTDNDELQISFLGYKTVTMQIGTRTAIAATLEEDSGYLDEVVVVGYGTTTRRHIISAVSTVKSEAIENRPVANIQQALQGAAANLIIQTKNFNPTDNQMNISIRGVNTMGNNTPLVVIDGVPQPDAGRMNDLNPNDIESINILKDAGSAAIYGARSSNGVILITTKNGRKEMAPQIRFSAKVGVENPDILYKAVPTYRNAILRNEALSNVGREPLFTAAEIQDFYNHGDCEAAVEQAMQNALQQNYNVSVTGGTKTTTYMLSASYFDQESNYVGPDYGVKRYNLRSNLTTEFGRLKLGANVGFTRSEINSPSDANEGFLFADLVRFPNYYFNRHEENGIFFGNNYKYGGYSVSPLAGLMGGGTNKNDHEYLTGTFTADFEIIKGLKARAVLGGEVRHEHRFTSHKTYQYVVDNGAAHSDISTATTGGNTKREADDWTKKVTFVTAQLMLDYNRTFKEKHNVTGLFGWSDESEIGYDITAARQGMNSIDQPGDGSIATEGTKLSSQSKYRRALQSFFGRAGYSYDDRYYFEFTARYDMSSKFLKERNGAFFPSVSLGWRMSQENFMQTYRDRVGDLKLRASYGLNGNQQDVGDYDFMTTYGTWANAYGFNGVPVQGLMFTMGNELLTWETAKTFNIGVDATFFKNTLSVNFDYFYKRTEDILLSPIVPGTFGASIAKENRGILDNQGWELTINYNLSRGNWKHNFSLNLADSQNEVVRYGTPAIRTSDSAGTIIMEGLPINALYGWKTNGFFQNYDEIQDAALPTGIDRSQLRPGDVRYVDLNGDGKIDENDRTYLGYAFPRYTYGFTYNVKWKGIDFSIMLQGVLKRENPVRGELVQPFHGDYSMTMFDHQLDYWSPQNRDARWPRLAVSGSVSDTNNWGHTGSDMMLLEGAYMRIKNIQLGYTLPKKWTKKFGCEALRIYFDTQNPLTWTKNGFVDPETTSFGNNMSGGADNSVRNYPTLRYFGGGIDLTF